MMSNHLPGDIASMGVATFSEMPMVGIGFGLGGSVLLDPARAQVLGSAGEFAWGGVASTGFWIDRSEAISVIMATQLVPSSSWPVRRGLRNLVYQALADCRLAAADGCRNAPLHSAARALKERQRQPLNSTH